MAPQLPPVGDPVPPVRLSQPTQPAQAAQAQQPAQAPSPEAAEAPAPQEQVQVQPLAGQAQAPVVQLVQDTPDLKAQGESLFASKMGVSSHNTLKGDNPRLLAQLKQYNDQIEKTPGMKQAIGRNPRGLDFLNTLEKASQGQKLSRDDIQSLQLFLAKDTRFGSALAYAGEPTGTDGKFGVRTLGTLDHFVNHFQASDLVPDAYYDRLDKEGVPYARLK